MPAKRPVSAKAAASGAARGGKTRPRREADRSTLGRGLRLLEHVTLAGGPVRFSELRGVLPGVQDPTLARLLQGLEASGHLRRVDSGGYAPGAAMERWAGALATAPREPTRLFQEAAGELVRRTNESAGVAVLEGERLTIADSRTAPGAVSIIEPGQVLHFEPDHAAALVVLETLPATRRGELLRASTSRMAGEREYAAAWRALHAVGAGGEAWVDRSRARPGICRLAAAFAVGAWRGAVFFCLTVERAEQGAEELAEALLAVRNRLREGLADAAHPRG